MRRFQLVAAFVLALAAIAGLARLAYAAKATPLKATFQTSFGTTGVFGDDLPLSAPNTYVHQTRYPPGAETVKCYIGSNNKDVDLVTYNSGRTLRFKFDDSPESPFQKSGLAALVGPEFNAEVDLFAINYVTDYITMPVGWTARVQMDLEFHVDVYTYELDYQNLVAIKKTSDIWLITSYRGDVDPYSDVFPNAEADLNIIRRRSQTKFGKVTMPIRFLVEVKK